MALVGLRSKLRFVLLSVVYMGFIAVAFVPDVNLLIRIACGCLAIWAVIEAVGFLRCARVWRIRGDTVDVPTPRNPARQIPISALRDATVFGGGMVRFIKGLQADDQRGFEQLAINLFVSTSDMQRWLARGRELARR